MITTVMWSGYFTIYLTSFVLSLVFIVVTCVCNPKSKRFHKHKSFILSHDLTNETSHNANSSCEGCEVQTIIDGGEEQLNKPKSLPLNRALPDIPYPSVASTSKHNVDRFNRSQFSNDDLDSLYNTANNVSVNVNENHAYARIRNNVSVDSSTENDTDDYSEPRIFVVNAEQLLPEVINNDVVDNLQLNENQNVAYELEPNPHILLPRENNLETALNNGNESKKEISYNTISVREPLSKVLAERENVEHHYNEVEEERVSSFYEEIATASITYSKIGDEDLKPSSYHYPNDQANLHTNNAQDVGNIPLYSFVDKKSKKSNSQKHNSSLDNVNILYTKVMKPSPSRNAGEPKVALQRYSPPPPLPPPLNKDSHQSKHLNRNTINFESSSSFTTFDDGAVGNIYQKITPEDNERDPGYETVYKEVDPIQHFDVNQPDYGYEAIVHEENDPAYEIVKPDNGYETIKMELAEDVADPNYEIIHNASRVESTADQSHPEPSERSISVLVNSDDNIVIIEHL